MRDRAKSAGRALDVLAAVSARPEGMTFTELQAELELPKSSLHDVIEVLAGKRFVEIDHESHRVTLAVRSWEVGARYFSQHDLVAEARPIMQGVVSELNETVQLAILDGLDNVYLAKIDCSHPVRLQSEVGKRLPAHATGLGKVLLASREEAELRAKLEAQSLPRFTTSTVTDVEVLLRHLESIRAAGFAVDDQEYTLGLRCVAVPIYDHRGRATAALSASVPMMRAHLTPLWQALRLIAEASIRISERIGATHESAKLRSLSSATQAKAAIARALPDGDQPGRRLVDGLPAAGAPVAGR